MAAQMQSKPSVKHAITLNKSIDRSHNNSSVGWTWKSDTGITLENARVFVALDASLADVDDPIYGDRTKSQCGIVAGFCNQ